MQSNIAGFYMEKSGSIAVVVLTSNVMISDIRYMIDGKVNWALMWNLSRDIATQRATHL